MNSYAEVEVMNPENIIEEIIKLKSSKKRGALATIIETKGSTPTKAGTKMVIFSEGRALIKGAKDEKEARSLYARFVGT